jgi:hypothetical protein
VNRSYRRSGTLWEGRFRSCLTQEETYLLACQRYIELNPVRADMAAHPAEYRWSSYRANAQGEEDALVRPHPLYEALGGTRQAARRHTASCFVMNWSPAWWMKSCARRTETMRWAMSASPNKWG